MKGDSPSAGSYDTTALWGKKGVQNNRRVPVLGKPVNKEIKTMTTKIPLNLQIQEFITAVNNQPKPLVIPLCAEIPLPDLSPLDIYTGTRYRLRIPA